MRGPGYHAKTHCPGGSDPIPCLTPPVGDTYPDVVFAHSCLVHYWPADEPSGDLDDRKGSWTLTADTATVSSTTYPQYGAAGPLSALTEHTAVVNAGDSGVTGHDARFYNDFGTAAFWTGSAPFTVELWVYLTGYGNLNNATILSTDGFTIPMLSKKLKVGRGAVTLSDPADMPLNAWQYVVVRYDSTTLELFRNAALIDSAASGSVNATTTLSWMNNYLGPSWSPVNGRSAQLAIYDCAISDADIASHYALKDAGDTATAGLVLQSDGAGGTTWDLVDTPSLADDSVTTAKIAADAVTASEIAAGAVGSSELASTAVSPGTYGDGTHVGQFTVDADGRLTAASNVSISGGGGAVASDTIWDAKGDLAVASAADTAAKLSVGANATVLEADSGQTLGVKWAARIKSLAKAGATALTGDVTLTGGAGVTLTQSGNDISIAASASGSGSDDGWLDDTAETWTYASGSGGGTATFTVTGDLTAKYTKGTRIKLTQTTVKYFVVIGSSVSSGTTTVTITAGSDYTLANAAISVNYHSYQVNPQGYPTWFNYASGATGWSSLSTNFAMFAVTGSVCFVQMRLVGTSNSTSTSASLPVASAQSSLNIPQALGGYTDNGGVNTLGLFYCSASTTIKFRLGLTTDASWTASGTKAVGSNVFNYQI